MERISRECSRLGCDEPDEDESWEYTAWDADPDDVDVRIVKELLAPRLPGISPESIFNHYIKDGVEDTLAWGRAGTVHLIRTLRSPKAVGRHVPCVRLARVRPHARRRRTVRSIRRGRARGPDDDLADLPQLEAA